MKHIRIRWFFVWAVSLMLVACKEDVPPIDIALQPNYQGILEAITQSNKTLAEKVALIEAAQRDGLADDQAAIGMIRQAVALLSGSLEEKLAAIEAAVKAQATSLEAKLTLIEAAVGNGFSNNASAQALMQQAIAALGGTLEEKVAAIKTAIGNQETALSARMALIEAAVKGGFVAASEQQSLIQSMLASLDGSAKEKLAAVESAITSQTTSLVAKLALIETALETLDGQMENLGLDLILKAVSSLGGTLEEKLAAMETAVTSQTTSLASKLALIQTAVTNGFAGDKTALGLVQTALETLKTQLGGMDDGLSKSIDKLSTGLGALLTNVNVDMATVLANILSAIQGQPDYNAVVAAIQQIVTELEQAIVPFRLKYVGEPTLTTANGGAWKAVIQVKPANTVLDEKKLKLNILSHKRFYPTWGSNPQGDVSTDSYSFSLAADSSVEGQYIVTISCRSPYVSWTEYSVALSATYGSPEDPKEVSTEPFNVVMMPKPLQGLKYWTYPAASFTFKRNGSINNIYYALDTGIFETQDESESRSYTADNLESLQLLPQNDSIAPVFINLDKNKRMAVFIPDTAGVTYSSVFWPDKVPEDRGGWRVWRSFKDSSRVDNEAVLGKLILKDRWDVKDTIPQFRIAWYNSVWFPESAIVPVNDIQNDNTAVVDLRSLFSKLGLVRSWLEGRFILQEQYGNLDGPYFKMSAQLLPETLKLAVRFQADPVPGAKFGMTAHYDLWIFPTETDPQFKVLALSFSYSLVVTIVN